MSLPDVKFSTELIANFKPPSGVTPESTIRPTGPKDAKIVIIGEAPGETEIQMGIPFVGGSGQELTRMLQEVDIPRSSCYLTNVFKTRPPQGDFDNWTLKKTEVPKGYSLPPLAPGKYLSPELFPALEEFVSEIKELQPNIIITLGNIPLWAMLGLTKITKHRGTVVESPFGKILPTYHPAMILRQWQNRPVMLADLLKAKRESEFPELRRLDRTLIIKPTLDEVKEFFALPEVQKFCAYDIETACGTITCLSIAPSPLLSISIPFVDKTKSDFCYWTREEELVVLGLLIPWLRGPCIKVCQNGMYDIQWTWEKMRTPVNNFDEDTMLLHNAMFPELPKGLGFLGSIYTNETSWKNIRNNETTKADDE